jgi:predicted HTH domain antitoxin
MQITVELPDDIIQPDALPRRVLEAFAIQAYEQAKISSETGGQLLGMSRLEFLDFLGAHNVPTYTSDQLERDIAYVESLHETRAAVR